MSIEALDLIASAVSVSPDRGRIHCHNESIFLTFRLPLSLTQFRALTRGRRSLRACAPRAVRPTPWRHRRGGASRSLRADLDTHPRDLVADPVALHSALRSAVTLPDFRITLASPKSPVAGSPVRLKATAPIWPGFRDNASARFTVAFGLKHSVGSVGAMPSSDGTKGSATQ